MVDPGLHREIAKYGGKDVTGCMNCGNCTAVCSLSTESEAFPRKIIHILQIGHRQKLAESLEPWLCYYCGNCSDTCPREANPGETMMAARRYLTALYDWTGLGRRFYTSPAWEIGAMVLVGLVVAVLIALFHGPVVTSRVELNTFAPVKWVETGDWIMGGALALLLLTNARRMYRLAIGSGSGNKVPVPLLLREARTFFSHLVTQKRWSDCEGQRTRRAKHLLLASGYVTMLALVVFALRWFQTDEIHPVWHPTRLLGYYATAVLLYVSADFLAGRLKKREPIHKSSEASDWIFLSLMFLVALTGILVHAFRLGGLPLPTYVMYAIHLVLVAPFLIVEVPFGKWSHVLYRPLAVYLAAVKRAVAETSTAATDRAA